MNIYIQGHFSGVDNQNIRIVIDRELYQYQTTNPKRIWIKNSIRESKINETFADFVRNVLDKMINSLDVQTGTTCNWEIKEFYGWGWVHTRSKHSRQRGHNEEE